MAAHEQRIRNTLDDRRGHNARPRTSSRRTELPEHVCVSFKIENGRISSFLRSVRIKRHIRLAERLSGARRSQSTVLGTGRQSKVYLLRVVRERSGDAVGQQRLVQSLLPGPWSHFSQLPPPSLSPPPPPPPPPLPPPPPPTPSV